MGKEIGEKHLISLILSKEIIKKSPLPHTHRETGLEKVITQTDSRLLAYYEIWLIRKQVDG